MSDEPLFGAPRACSELEWAKKVRDCLARNGYPSVTVEHRLWDGSRVDIFASGLCCEVEWANKWAESIGQVTWYAESTNKPPAVVLLVEDMEAEARFIYRCKIVCTKLSYKLWLVDTRKNKLLMDSTPFDL